jgi:hypothetical protein
MSTVAKVESVVQLTSVGVQMIRVIAEMQRHQQKRRIPSLIESNVLYERVSMSAVVSRYIINGESPEEISKIFKERGLDIGSSSIEDVVRHAFARTLELERESQEKAGRPDATPADKWFAWRSLSNVVRSIHSLFPAGEVTTQDVEINLVGLLRQLFDKLREKSIDINSIPNPEDPMIIV